MIRLVALSVLLCVIATSGCGPSEEVGKLSAENADLRKEIERLTTERDELKFGAARLLAQAEAARQRRAWAEAATALEQLLSKHPGARETVRAKALLGEVTLALKEEEAAAARERTAQEAAERRRSAEEASRIASAVSKMRKKVDEIEGVTWYEDRTTPVYASENSLHIYIGKHATGSPWLRLRVQYTADDWLFIESFLVVADGVRFETSPAKFERDNSVVIWEWYDEMATARDLEMVKAVIKSEKAVLRLEGRQYRSDRTISAAEKRALQNVLDAYVALGGSLQ